MQCVNCGFENAPGLTRCAQCQSSMDLAGVSIEPPRRRKGLLGYMARPFWRMRTGVVQPLRERMGITWRLPPAFRWAAQAMVWSLLPGLGQIARGRRRLGYPILAAWLVLGLLAVSYAGSGTGWLLYYLMLGVQCLAIGLTMAPAMAQTSVGVRLITGLCVFLFLHVVLYGSIRWGSALYAQPLELPNIPRNSLIATDDVLLVQGPVGRPKAFSRGDLVVYAIGGGYAHGGPGNYYVQEGTGIDRIVGQPGDRIQIAHQQVLVNGLPPERRNSPLADVSGWQDVPELTAGADEYLILPSLFPPSVGAYGNQQAAREAYLRMVADIVRVKADRIQGKVLWRVRPLKRWGTVE